MTDVTPELLESIEAEFAVLFSASPKIKTLYSKLEKGIATFEEANNFAIETGNVLAKVFKRKLSSAVLPDGRMYYNIAERILNKTLGRNYDLISKYAATVQQILNENAGLGLKPIVPDINQDRIDGIIDRLAEAENFDEIAWILEEPTINFSQSIIDELIKANADFHKELGLQEHIERISVAHCCKWCDALAGSYEYYADTMPEDIFRRHERCRCKVIYYPGNGRRQNAHTKKWL